MKSSGRICNFLYRGTSGAGSFSHLADEYAVGAGAAAEAEHPQLFGSLDSRNRDLPSQFQNSGIMAVDSSINYILGR